MGAVLIQELYFFIWFTLQEVFAFCWNIYLEKHSQKGYNQQWKQPS